MGRSAGQIKKIFVIILDFKAKKDLANCLESLKKTAPVSGWQLQTLVIDNNQKNLGFAAGCNVGIREALKHKAEAVLLLNQDTIVEKNFLADLVKNSADIVGPVIKFRRAEKWVYDFGGKINWWFGRAKHRETRVEEPDYVSGCAMLIRRKVLEKIGLLNERYFLYFEDVDFCLRAKRAGFKISVEPKSQIIHHLAEKKPLASRRYLISSHWRFINHWVRWPFKILAYFYWLLVSVKIWL